MNTEADIPAGSTKLRAQPGKQAEFLRAPADITVFGGSAGSGKSYALLIDPTRYLHKPGFNSTIFRRTSPQIRQPGGLWSVSKEIYSGIGGESRETTLEWRWPQYGTEIRFSHLEHEDDKWSWYGAQLCHLGFDELVTFTEGQFWFLISRNRSTCGVRPYIRCTTNPDPDSWVKDLIAWWLDLDRVENGVEIEGSGYAIPERSGKIRWFYRVHDQLHWFDSRKEAVAYAEQNRFVDPVTNEAVEPKSLTFIPATIYDNLELL